ncbi:MAG TPA: hypothetical protein VJA66_00495 [Thermoanaerobaculia bacterium]
MNSSLLVRASLVVGVVALAVPCGADTADTSSPAAAPAQGHLVIRGTGNDVRIEREAAPPAARRQFGASRTAVLDELSRMSKGGVAEPLLITYLKTHAREVPKVLNQEDLRRLESAGVSDSVIAYLKRTSAVDIGLSGEGHEAPVYVSEASPGQYPPGVYTDDMGGYGYDWAYGSGYGGYSPFHRRFLFFHHQKPFPVRPRPIPLGFGPPKTMAKPTMGMVSRSRRPGDGF